MPNALPATHERLTVIHDGEEVTVEGLRVGFVITRRPRAHSWVEFSLFETAEGYSMVKALRSFLPEKPPAFEVFHYESADHFIEDMSGRQTGDDLIEQADLDR